MVFAKYIQNIRYVNYIEHQLRFIRIGTLFLTKIKEYQEPEEHLFLAY